MLTDTQYTTLTNHIRGNTDPDVVAALAIRNDTELARLYNLDSSFVVWRSKITPEEYESAVVWTEIIAQTVGERDMWRLMTANHTRDIDATSANVRQGIADAFDQNTTTRNQLLTLGKRAASVFEEIFATGTGTDQNPGVADPEGPLTINNVSYALNNF